jgi:hypothetical protein
MHAERVQGVVVTKSSLDVIAREVGGSAGCKTDGDRAACGDKTAGRRDCGQSGNSAGAESENARFAAPEVFDGGPGETTCRR